MRCVRGRPWTTRSRRHRRRARARLLGRASVPAQRVHASSSSAPDFACTAQVEFGPEASAIPTNGDKYPQTANISLARHPGRNRMISRDSAILGRTTCTTENRGVPGSSPGLAIARKSVWILDLAVSGVSIAIRKKGMKRGRSAETLVSPRNSWTADPRWKRVMVSCARSNRRHHDFRRSRGVPGWSVGPEEGVRRSGIPRLRNARMPRRCRRPGEQQPQSLRPAPDDAGSRRRASSGRESATRPLPFG